MLARVRNQTQNHDTTNVVPRRLLNRNGAAAYLSVSPAYIDALRVQGVIQPVALPSTRGDSSLRTPLYDVRDLDNLIEAGKPQKQQTGGL